MGLVHFVPPIWCHREGTMLSVKGAPVGWDLPRTGMNVSVVSKECCCSVALKHEKHRGVMCILNAVTD